MRGCCDVSEAGVVFLVFRYDFLAGVKAVRRRRTNETCDSANSPAGSLVTSRRTLPQCLHVSSPWRPPSHHPEETTKPPSGSQRPICRGVTHIVYRHPHLRSTLAHDADGDLCLHLQQNYSSSSKDIIRSHLKTITVSSSDEWMDIVQDESNTGFDLEGSAPLWKVVFITGPSSSSSSNGDDVLLISLLIITMPLAMVHRDTSLSTTFLLRLLQQQTMLLLVSRTKRFP